MNKTKNGIRSYKVKLTKKEKAKLTAEYVQDNIVSVTVFLAAVLFACIEILQIIYDNDYLYTVVASFYISTSLYREFFNLLDLLGKKHKERTITKIIGAGQLEIMIGLFAMGIIATIVILLDIKIKSMTLNMIMLGFFLLSTFISLCKHLKNLHSKYNNERKRLERNL